MQNADYDVSESGTNLVTIEDITSSHSATHTSSGSVSPTALGGKY